MTLVTVYTCCTAATRAVLKLAVLVLLLKLKISLEALSVALKSTVRTLNDLAAERADSIGLRPCILSSDACC